MPDEPVVWGNKVMLVAYVPRGGPLEETIKALANMDLPTGVGAGVSVSAVLNESRELGASWGAEMEPVVVLVCSWCGHEERTHAPDQFVGAWCRKCGEGKMELKKPEDAGT